MEDDDDDQVQMLSIAQTGTIHHMSSH